eukprot:5914111-Pyramimonas_sp.AAC.3
MVRTGRGVAAYRADCQHTLHPYVYPALTLNVVYSILNVVGCNRRCEGLEGTLSAAVRKAAGHKSPEVRLGAWCGDAGAPLGLFKEVNTV